MRGLTKPKRNIRSICLRLAKHKAAIKQHYMKYGRTATIHFCEGLLGLRYGEYGKYRPYVTKCLGRILK